jgi:hypothetical protein
VPSCSMGFCVASTKNGGSSVIRLAGRRDRPLLHRLEQGGLRLGRRPVDLVGEHDVREDRPLHEAEDAPARGPVLLDDLRARDVRGHEVRGELDAAELEVERLGQRLHEEGLGEPRHAHEQGVAVGEERDEQLLDDFVLAHDALPWRIPSETSATFSRSSTSLC